MSYAYDTKKRFSGKKPYSYWLEDSYYKSDSVMKKGGRKFKKFYDELAQHIFDINLELVEQIGDLPITYNERSNSATIAMALSRLTTYVMSECGLDCKGVALPGKNDKNKQRRFVDFWCGTDDFDIWIESKHLWFNIGKGAKRDEKNRRKFTADTHEAIQQAFDQIRGIKTLTRQKRATEGVKIALFAINAYCATSRLVDDMSELDSLPREVAEMLEAEMLEHKTKNCPGSRQKFGVLVSALDLRKDIAKDIKGESTYQIWRPDFNYYLPFVLLGAVVLP